MKFYFYLPFIVLLINFSCLFGMDTGSSFEQDLKLYINKTINSQSFTLFQRWKEIADVRQSEFEILDEPEHDGLTTLFGADDEEAVKLWAQAIALRFLQSARFFVEQKLVLADLYQTSHSIAYNASPETISVYKTEFTNHATQAITSLFDKHGDMVEAMRRCSTTTCIQNIKDSALAMTTFASHLQNQSTAPSKQLNNFNTGILHRLYNELIKAQTNQNSSFAFALIIREFISVHHGEKSARDMSIMILGDINSFSAFGLGTPPFTSLHRREIPTAVNRIGDISLASMIASMTHSQDIKVPDTAIVDVEITLKCYTKAAAIGVGIFKGFCTDELGTQYKIKGAYFGPTAYAGLSNVTMTIYSSSPRTVEGTWQGMSMLGALGLGASGGIFTNHKSIAIAGDFMFGIGGGVQASWFTLKRSKH